MVRTTFPDDFDQIVEALTHSDLKRMVGTRWRDSDGSEVSDPVAMARRLHAHGYIPNIDRLLMVSVGGSITAGLCRFTREA